MEIRSGYGPQGNRVSGPVHVGDPLTLLVNMRSRFDGFDIVVNDCYAHNGANKKIQLIDHHGCPVDEKLISKFQGTWGMDGAMYQTVVYAHMKTFRFTGTPALYIECDIRMCHGRCPTQSCNWRSLNGNGIKKRKRRSRRETLEEDLEEDVEITETMSASNSSGLSENVRMFQSIHVLQSREDELEEDFGNATSTATFGLDAEDNVCMSSMIFAAVFGGLALVALLSSVSVSLLCMRLKRSKENSENNNPLNLNMTMRPMNKSNVYVHSRQQRIP